MSTSAIEAAFKKAIEHAGHPRGVSHSDAHPHFIGGVYAKEVHLKAGETLISHKHAYDHMSILAQGEARLSTGTDTQDLKAPRVIHVRAGIHHALYTLTDCVWFCIHAVDEAQEAVKNQDMAGTDGLLIVKGK